LKHAVFDVNGPLAIDGLPIQGVIDRLQALAEYLSLYVLTAGTYGNITALECILSTKVDSKSGSPSGLTIEVRNYIIAAYL
jgi:hypothetical protein